jgi:hypothetical protein
MEMEKNQTARAEMLRWRWRKFKNQTARAEMVREKVKTSIKNSSEWRWKNNFFCKGGDGKSK